MSASRAGAALLSIVGWWMPATVEGQPRPNPALAPAEVIRTVVEALQNRNSPSPNAGIFTVYQFASPANRVFAGPYGKFLGLVKIPPFAPLFSGHPDSFGPLTIAGDRAQQKIRFRVDGGGEFWFLFALSRQSSQQTRGRCAGCWMVDGVAPMSHEPLD